MIREITTVVYKTSDNQTFDDEDEAQLHENEIEIEKLKKGNRDLAEMNEKLKRCGTCFHCASGAFSRGLDFSKSKAVNKHNNCDKYKPYFEK